MHYKIKQIKLEDRENKKIGYVFMRYSYAIDHGFNLNDYTVVYEGEITPVESENEVDMEKYLEDLFYTFNMQRPENFEGHSLSVSDIVELDGVNYYCDSAGWVKISK